jgi:hypothetical protein
MSLGPATCAASDLCCVLSGCATGVSPETLDEVTLIGKANRQGNFVHRSIAFPNQPARELYATTLEKFHRCQTGAGAK